MRQRLGRLRRLEATAVSPPNHRLWREPSPHILHLALAIRNRGYTNEVRQRKLTENQGFETRAGG
ncbi:MAG: hypothetical protein V7K67_17400 [Nostoc sp.]|uniref:hypothetical protein n=1 Tax=Nostoc sp. TaxID=1180 RepID=UPI002FFA6D45